MNSYLQLWNEAYILIFSAPLIGTAIMRARLLYKIDVIVARRSLQFMNE